METLQDSILIILRELGINHSKFADEIGVQRSSISHVLSGRNKPSFEFLQKLFQAYPKINADWLIIGREPMFLPSNEQGVSAISDKSFVHGESNSSEALELGGEQKNQVLRSEDSPSYGKGVSEISIPRGSEGIDTVLILYKDGSFREYNSRSSPGA